MTACQAYETLRGQVLQGQARPDGLGAIVFHGMWRGLVVLLDAPPPKLPPSISSAVVADVPSSPTPRDPQLVRLLANMLLLTQSKDEYAY